MLYRYAEKVLTGDDGGGAVDDGDQIPPPIDLVPEDAEPGFLAIVGNLFHRAGEAFEGNVGSGLTVHVLLLIFPTGAR